MRNLQYLSYTHTHKFNLFFPRTTPKKTFLVTFEERNQRQGRLKGEPTNIYILYCFNFFLDCTTTRAHAHAHTHTDLNNNVFGGGRDMLNQPSLTLLTGVYFIIFNLSRQQYSKIYQNFSISLSRMYPKNIGTQQIGQSQQHYL